MFGARKTTRQESTPYAVSADFCRIFQKDMNRLYLLSLFLTADPSMAQECFVRGLEDAANSHRVFKQWAHSWARRKVVQNAIQMIRARPTDSTSGFGPGHAADRGIADRAEIMTVLALPQLERFVFVLSVLERYSDQECSLLLDCSRAEVIADRTRALEQIASFVGPRADTVSTGSGRQAQAEDAGSELQLEALSPVLA